MSRYWVSQTSFGVCALMALTAPACTESDVIADPDVIADQLEQENGGLTMDDEAPRFGDLDLFEQAVLSDDELAIADDMETSPEVVAMIDAGDSDVIDLVVTMNQVTDDLDAEARDWSGRLTLNRGALLVRRRLAAAETDRIERRTDRRIVDFRAETRPELDGLRLRIIDDWPRSAERLRITYEGRDGTRRDLDVRDLVDQSRSDDVDGRGNRLSGAATRRPVDVCDSAFVHGRWHQVRGRSGIIVGRVHNADGDEVGHLRGVYGHRRDGEPVLFAKFIDRSGRFRGLIRGTFGDNRFAGRWLARSGDHGTIAGIYREVAPGDEVGGFFLGRMHETSCGQ